MTHTITRRSALKAAASALAVPMIFRSHTASAKPSEAVRLMAVGAGGRGTNDIMEMAESPHFQLVAFADVDPARARDVIKKFPKAKVFTDWRKMFDEVKEVDAVSCSTPDHMHAPVAMTALKLGKAVCCQKPLTHTLYEARQLAKVSEEKKLVTQMGIQIHSHPVHKSVVHMIQDGVIGKVKEVHSWSGKDWGDRGPKPMKTDPVPKGLNWDGWLGVASERPFIGGGYYHPGNWRKRLDFGCGTFGDMGCHILDPVFGSLGLTYPKSVRASDGAPTEFHWGLDCVVKYVYPGTKFTTDELTLTWYDGKQRPGKDVAMLIGGKSFSDQGSVYIGTKGVMYSPYIANPVLFPTEEFKGYKYPDFKGDNHYSQFVEAVRGNGKNSAPFSYAGPLTELVLIGCLATRFQNETLQWDSAAMKVKNLEAANHFVRKTYRKGWEVEGL
ncbi:MAG: Gfo/Idh/MocA family oxidoreductase [Gemmataceae bacterium]